MRAALASLIALVVVACSQHPAPAPTPAASATTEAAPAPTYTCGRFAFDAATVGRGVDASNGDDPAARALRAYLATPGTDHDLLPIHDWTLAGIDALSAEFVARGADPFIPVVVVRVSQDGGTWRVTDGGECEAHRDMGPARTWAKWFLPSGERLEAATTTFPALVTGQVCAAGDPPAGRILAPEIVETPDSVVVTFATRALPAPTTSCDNPPTRIDVVLPTPLGIRQLRDGSTMPFGDPRPPACCGDQSSDARG
jgi:hypothetical protein